MTKTTTKRSHDKYYTELDRTLRDLAVMDWPAFVELVGYETIKNAKICLLKQRGKSYNQIANNLSLTKGAVRYRSENCEPCKASGEN